MFFDIYHHYDIAFRNSKCGRFQLVSPPHYGWVADPFLVEYRGVMYLFAEIFLYNTERNGVLGYCKWDEEHQVWSEWTVTMDRHWHLSYPNVYVYLYYAFQCCFQLLQ